MNSVTFDDGSSLLLGHRVQFQTACGTIGRGTVIGFVPPGDPWSSGEITIKIRPDDDTTYGSLDRWETPDGYYNRLLTDGIPHSAIVARFAPRRWGLSLGTR